MGISIDKYRAVIGRWNAGRMRRLLSPPTPVRFSEMSPYQHEQQDTVLIFRRPWKPNLAVLCILMSTLLLSYMTTYPPATGSLPEVKMVTGCACC